MLTSNELELRANVSLGTLESNAEAIRDLVMAKLKDYTPENYVGRVEEAKADRALLNNADKALNAKRLELERAYMEPFNKFKVLITETCKAIKQASGGLDEIVKGEEQRERMEKFETIQKYWDESGFTLFDISKVYDNKWTNKTTKLKDIYAEIDAIQKKTFDELKILENFPQEDVALLKTIYLDTLDITQAMQKAEQLKANRERLAKEKVEREVIEHRKAVEAQRENEINEAQAQHDEEKISDLAAEALGLEIEAEEAPELETYALEFKGTRQQLLALKRYMTESGILYTKLVDKGCGLYAAE